MQRSWGSNVLGVFGKVQGHHGTGTWEKVEGEGGKVAGQITRASSSTLGPGFYSQPVFPLFFHKLATWAGECGTICQHGGCFHWCLCVHMHVCCGSHRSPSRYVTFAQLSQAQLVGMRKLLQMFDRLCASRCIRSHCDFGDREKVFWAVGLVQMNRAKGGQACPASLAGFPPHHCFSTTACYICHSKEMDNGAFL